MSYRPLTDVWLLARSKVKYYGAYPSGFLHRARALLGVGPFSSVLHVCAGKVREYPYRGFGVNDYTLDLDPACEPNYLQDAREPFPDGPWDAVLIDRPYTEEDANRYIPGARVLPAANLLVKHGINAVSIGGKVGILDYLVPHPPKNAGFVALVGVSTGYNNRIRAFSVFERLS